MPVLLAVAIAALAIPSALPAQREDPLLFLPRARIAAPLSEQERRISPRDETARGKQPGIMLEADIFPPIPLVRRFSREELFGGGRGFNLYVTPQNVVRVLDDFSGTLRSPSFMPRFDAQFLVAVNDSADVLATSRTVFGVTVTHGHHSNGGPGCLLREEGPVDDAEAPFGQRCVRVAESALGTATVDPNGSFSTNFWRVAGTWARVSFSGDRIRVMRLVAVSPFVEVHPSGMEFLYLLGGRTTNTQRAVYGPVRLGARVNFEQPTRIFSRNGRVGVDFDYTHISTAKREAYFADWTAHAVTVSATYGFDAGKLSGWALLLRFFQGQDYYNLAGVREIRRLDLGLDIGRGFREAQ